MRTKSNDLIITEGEEGELRLEKRDRRRHRDVSIIMIILLVNVCLVFLAPSLGNYIRLIGFLQYPITATYGRYTTLYSIEEEEGGCRR